MWSAYSCTGVLHESYLHSRYKKLKSNRGLRASRSRRCPIMAPATMAGPTMGKEACLGTVGRARPGHVGSMAASSADDHLTVGGDADVVVSAEPIHAAGPSMHISVRWLLDGGTQSMPLSATIKQRLVCGAHRGPYSNKSPASTTNIAFGPPAER